MRIGAKALSSNEQVITSNTRFSQVHDWARRWLAALTMLLVVVTWQLWAPRASTQYPRVPFWAILNSAPDLCDWGALAFMLIGLALVVAGRRNGPWVVVGLGMFGVGAVLAVLLDQQRFQPWIYHALLLLPLLSIRNSRLGILLAQWIVISVYAYSALGKLDYQFLHTVGRQFVSVLASFVGSDSRQWLLSTQVIAAALLPLAEAAIAIGLVFQKSRRMAGAAAFIFHVNLFIVFSPLGLNHSRGVLLWNIAFAGQALLLFVLPRVQPAEWFRLDRSITSRGALSATVIVISMPITERAGYFDHWPSWALYAPHCSRTTIQVSRAIVDKLPAELGQLTIHADAHVPAAEQDAVEMLWIDVPIEKWCLEATATPIYPQNRSQLGIAIHLARLLDTEVAVRCDIQSTADRFSGERESRRYRGMTDIEQAASKFRLNAIPHQ